MGQTKSTCAQEEKMSERIANKMRTYDDFALHLSQANEWYESRDCLYCVSCFYILLLQGKIVSNTATLLPIIPCPSPSTSHSTISAKNVETW